MSCWIGCDTITWCRIEDDCCLALLDTGVTINVINADYARMLDLPMGPLSDLREGLQGVKFMVTPLLEHWAMSLFVSDLTK